MLHTFTQVDEDMLMTYDVSHVTEHANDFHTNGSSKHYPLLPSNGFGVVKGISKGFYFNLPNLPLVE